MAKRLPTYRNDEITVTFDPVRCIHARRCVQGLPEVFDPKAKPWVRVDRASAELIADVIRQCPTGALHYERRSGAGETADADPTIRIGHNGPIYLRGAIELKLESGETIHRHPGRPLPLRALHPHAILRRLARVGRLHRLTVPRPQRGGGGSRPMSQRAAA